VPLNKHFHPERSHSVREASGMAESKDPYAQNAVENLTEARQ
jgi:hypothetical protein